MKSMFALHDLKAEAMLDPFTSINLQTAMRKTQIDLSNDEKLRDFAADFCLMEVGTWDPILGMQRKEPTVVIQLSQLLETPDGEKQD